MKKITAIFLAAVLAACFTATAVLAAADDSADVSVDFPFDPTVSADDPAVDDTTNDTPDISFDFTEDFTSDETDNSGDGFISDDTVDTTDDITSADIVDTTDDIISEEPSEDDGYTNVALGKPYTYENSDKVTDAYSSTCADTGRLLTDGIYRSTSQLTAGGDGKPGVTVEYAGSTRTHYITVDLEGKHTVHSVILGVARRAHNRFANVAEIEVSVNGGDFKKVDITETAVSIAGAPQYSEEIGTEGKDQFFNLVYSFAETENVTAVRVSINTAFVDEDKYLLTGNSGYIAQLDELMVMGVKTDDVTESSSIDDSSIDQGPATNPTGDAGIAVFALLAAVSLAGAVIAKKTKQA